MAAATDGTQPAQPKRPGATDGVVGEFTCFTKIKPGHEEALRAALVGMMNAQEKTRSALQEVPVLHTSRHVIFDQDTRYLFASEFDGSWDSYIDDFATTVVGENFGKLFAHTEGFPGIKDPNVKEWFVAHQEPALVFVSSYPDLTVKQIWRANVSMRRSRRCSTPPSSGRRSRIRPTRRCWPRRPSRSCSTKPQAEAETPTPRRSVRRGAYEVSATNRGTGWKNQAAAAGAS